MEKQFPTNIQQLQRAGIIPEDYKFSEADQQIIASLSPEEVQALIAIGDKLGPEFLQTHGGGPTAGILF